MRENLCCYNHACIDKIHELIHNNIFFGFGSDLCACNRGKEVPKTKTKANLKTKCSSHFATAKLHTYFPHEKCVSRILFQPCVCHGIEKASIVLRQVVTLQERQEPKTRRVWRAKHACNYANVTIFINNFESLCVGAKVKIIKFLDQNGVSYALVKVMWVETRQISKPFDPHLYTLEKHHLILFSEPKHSCWQVHLTEKGTCLPNCWRRWSTALHAAS